MDLSPSSQVRATARLICSHPNKHANVDEAACERAAPFLLEQLRQSAATPRSIAASWRSANGLHPPVANEEALQWIFTVDTLNFAFWTPEGLPPFTVLYKGKLYTGYWALCAAVNRALAERIQITDPLFWLSAHDREWRYVFRSATSTPIPMLKERVAVLKQAAVVLTEKYSCSIEKLVASCANSAQKLIKTIVSQFKSYDDSLPLSACTGPTHSTDREVAQLTRLCFYKRAQILAADIWACFADTDTYNFDDISTLTMFADYRVPQVLVWLGAIKYTNELTYQLDQYKRSRRVVLKRGCEQEVAIRACSIHAVELIRTAMERLQKQAHADSETCDDDVTINSIVIDYALWDYAKAHEHELAHIPIHHISSIFY